jgi:hypothetical protein
VNSRYHYFAAGVIGLLWFLALYPSVHAQDKEQAELAKALEGVTVSLQQGLSAAAKSGTPISGKFEVEDGKLQLSVYTMRGNQFSEVIVDHKTGRVTKTEKIESGEDLAAAKAQSAAMAKTKQSLRDALDRAVKANPGFRAVSVTADLEGGAPTAKLTLLQGTTFKTASEKLN